MIVPHNLLCDDLGHMSVDNLCLDFRNLHNTLNSLDLRHFNDPLLCLQLWNGDMLNDLLRDYLWNVSFFSADTCLRHINDALHCLKLWDFLNLDLRHFNNPLNSLYLWHLNNSFLDLSLDHWDLLDDFLGCQPGDSLLTGLLDDGRLHNMSLNAS